MSRCASVSALLTYSRKRVSKKKTARVCTARGKRQSRVGFCACVCISVHCKRVAYTTGAKARTKGVSKKKNNAYNLIDNDKRLWVFFIYFLSSSKRKQKKKTKMEEWATKLLLLFLSTPVLLYLLLSFCLLFFSIMLFFY